MASIPLNFPWTNGAFCFSFLESMKPPEQKLTTPLSLAVDAVLVIVFFLYMYSVLSTHVPSHDPHMILLWGIITTSCLTAVFWLALQMFRVVYRFQRQSKGKR